MAPKKNYQPEQMSRAVEAVKRGESVGAAAMRYGVPRITLRNKVTGKSPLECGMGPPTILTSEEEDILVRWLITLSDRHFPIDKEQLLDSVQRIIIKSNRENPFKNNRPGKKWYQSFLKRHQEIAQRTSQNLTISRDNVTEKDIKAWFDEIKKYLEEKNLMSILDDPKRIYNADESAFFLQPRAGRVLTRKGNKNVYSTAGNDKENLTVLVTANAAGQLPPPMIVFSYERIPSSISNSVPETWGIGRSETGWMCGSTFYEYVTNIFHPWLIKNKITFPIIFFIDGHGSHLTAHLSDFCSTHGIEVIALYPNSTHILQPMDISVFRPLKLEWKNQVTKWKMDHLGEQLKKEHFALVFKLALESITKDCIKNGFKAGGLYPFGPQQIDFTKVKVQNRDVKVTEETCLPRHKVFLETLETEVVEIFTQEKLDSFNRHFLNPNEKNPQYLPDADRSLYRIWAKYKKKSQNDVNTEIPRESIEIECRISDSDTLPQDSNDMADNSSKTSSESPSATINIPEPTTPSKHNINAASTSQSVSVTINIPALTSPLKNISNIPSTSCGELLIPSPFKTVLFWPEPEKKKRRICKEKVPSAITSKAWREYSENKVLKKKKMEEEKEERRKKREEKRRLKDQHLAEKKKISQINTPKKDIISSSESSSDIEYAESSNSELEENDVEYEELVPVDKENIKKGQFVIVSFKAGKRMTTTKKYLCIVDEIDSSDDVRVVSMKATDSSNQLFYVVDNDTSYVSYEQILGSINNPSIVARGERIYYKFNTKVDLI